MSVGPRQHVVAESASRAYDIESITYGVKGMKGGPIPAPLRWDKAAGLECLASREVRQGQQ